MNTPTTHKAIGITLTAFLFALKKSFQHFFKNGSENSMVLSL